MIALIEGPISTIEYAPAAAVGIDARQTMLLVHERRAAELRAAMLVMRLGAGLRVVQRG